MNSAEARENLLNLAAMRLMHTFPPAIAVAKWNEIYSLSWAPAVDEIGLRERRQQAIDTFHKMFDTDEEPRHAELYEQTNEQTKRES